MLYPGHIIKVILVGLSGEDKLTKKAIVVLIIDTGSEYFVEYLHWNKS